MTRKRTHLLAAALLFLFWGMANTSWAQRSAVAETEEEIKGIARQGQRILIQLDSKVVEKAWANFLKEKTGGSVKGPSLIPTAKAPKGVYLVEKASLPTVSENPLRIVSKVDNTKEGTAVWWTLDMGNAYLSQANTSKEWKESEALLQQFARSVYIEDVNNQISDAEKVLANSQQEEQRVAKQADEIKDKIAKNQSKKQELEAALVANAQDLEQLTKEVENNLKQQDAAKQVVNNMRRAVELVKAKLEKID